MKKFSLIFLLFISSCSLGGMSCIWPSEYDKNVAQSYYESFSSYRVDVQTHERLRKKFTCYYRAGDEIYAYSTFLGTKYILVRGQEAITYIDDK